MTIRRIISPYDTAPQKSAIPSSPKNNWTNNAKRSPIPILIWRGILCVMVARLMLKRRT